ncbi:acyl-CoA N-acyltransferase [Ceratobasidium sp. AG-I]|nr:acyl-CoA N-acyltransferase [Ceratobasidium sp. AG-I]
MIYVNTYAPPIPRVLTVLPDPTKPYDLNFCYPIRELSSDRVKLIPFIPHNHATAVYGAFKTYPEVTRYLPWLEYPSLESFELRLEDSRLNTGFCLFVALDKEKATPEVESDPEKVGDILLGTVAYINASRALSSLEIGYLFVFPPFQRTHVSSHMIGLTMQYALDSPNGGGLGVRRVQWQAHASNAPSVRAGKRMGFRMEGIIRWQRPLPAGKESSEPFRKDDELGLPGRHTVMLSVCWDDWEGGVKEHVRGLIERV